MNAKKPSANANSGVADAVSDTSILEITTRDNHYKTKVQQAHLYSSMMDKRVVYNYYIEQRLLVRRERVEPAATFIHRATRDLLVQRGLPGVREPLAADELESWTWKWASEP